MKPLSVYWWRSPDFVNIGDEINPVICEYASGRPFQHGALAECDFLAIGSVLHFPINQKIFQTRTAPMHVWGTGSMEPKPVPPEAPFVFHALRGHLTLCLTTAPQSLPLGDPGLLAPRRWPATPGKSHSWGIIPHHSQRKAPWLKKLLESTPGAVFIDVTNPDFAATFAQIAACERIAATSLHGLIFADAYGIPNVWLEGPEVHRGRSWKYYDYFSAVGRRSFRPVPRPVTGNLSDLPDHLVQADHLPGINAIADRVEQAFPKDI